MRYQSTEDRFWAKVHKVEEPRGCWEWIGLRTELGYGRFTIDGQGRKAHRMAYELLIGPIPEGLEPDHLCRNHGCVKVIADGFGPAHLELVTHQENLLRGVGFAAQHAKAKHCPQGHPYDPRNTYRDTKGRRYCITCRRARDAARTQNRQAVAGRPPADA